VKTFRISWCPAAVFAVVLSILAGCASVGQGPAPEEVVKQRAQLRWNALVQGDVKKAYEYYGPGTKATLSLAEFSAGMKMGFWKTVTVDKVECNAPDRCEVSTTIEYEHRGMRVKSPSRETWIREGSEWWLVRR
jgi:uncharacterized protein YchJ